MKANSPRTCTAITITYEMVECPKERLQFRIADTPTPVLTQASGGTNAFTFTAQATDGRRRDLRWYGVAFTAGAGAAANRFVEGWAVLAAAAKGAAVDDKGFDQVVASYAAANPKPELSEEARRFRVQAEAAARRKEFSMAADRYGQALKIAPWWPQGHYDLAVVYGELGQFSRAIGEMQRYLRLAPDAPNAREAKDKIYEWEGR